MKYFWAIITLMVAPTFASAEPNYYYGNQKQVREIYEKLICRNGKDFVNERLRIDDLGQRGKAKMTPGTRRIYEQCLSKLANGGRYDLNWTDLEWLQGVLRGTQTCHGGEYALSLEPHAAKALVKSIGDLFKQTRRNQTPNPDPLLINSLTESVAIAVDNGICNRVNKSSG